MVKVMLNVPFLPYFYDGFAMKNIHRPGAVEINQGLGVSHCAPTIFAPQVGSKPNGNTLNNGDLALFNH